MSVAAMRSAFEAAHKARFGFIDRAKALVVEAMSVEAVGGGSALAETRAARRADAPLPEPTRRTRVLLRRAPGTTPPSIARDQLRPGHRVDGPALLIEDHQTIVVEDGWRAELTARDDLVLDRAVPLPQRTAIGTSADPVMLEIFNNLFMSIAEQMGVTLQNTAYSVNIKERLDFSCAVFDADGALVANAPHMPVHLGSMDRSVESIIRNNAVIRPGDVFAINAPYNGGTHLPDITVCTPVFDEAARDAAVLGRLARPSRRCRRHRAGLDVAARHAPSRRRASISTISSWSTRACFREEELNALLTGAKYPVRNVVQNVNDLKAQIAANDKGVAELRRMVGAIRAGRGRAPIWAMCRTMPPKACARCSTGCPTKRRSAMRWTRAASSRCGSPSTAKAREATVDFTGTSPQRDDNFNAPEPVTRAAVLYVFRVMVEDKIPMNAGCLRPIRIVIPEGSMLSPNWPAAVVAGNVEVSQAVTNCLFGALGALAAAQGTMNNVNFGNDRYQYYETICSGAPAGEGFDGVDAIHTHMTNSRLTDPEILEWRFPVVLEDFHIRARLGRQGPLARGRRHQPHHPLPRAHGLRHALRPPAGAAVRPGGRRAGRNRPQQRPARWTGRIETLQAATRPCWKPAKRSPSSRRPAAAMATPHSPCHQGTAPIAATLRIWV